MIPLENDNASGREYTFNSVPEQLVHTSKSQGYLEVVTVFNLCLWPEAELQLEVHLV